MLLTNAQLATMTGPHPYGLQSDGSVVIVDETIVWAGLTSDLPQKHDGHNAIDLGGALVTPGLIDCHTHLVHGGNRAREFEMRLEGASYEELARAGGGIISTVEATRDASFEDLVASALPRLDSLISEGVCTIEIKSGYGLDQDNELKMLRVARHLETLRPVRIKTSFLGAHAVPIEYVGRADDYITDICLPTLEAAFKEGLVDAVDGFCEGIAFYPQQIELVFKKAKELGLPVKLHAEQLSNIGGIQLVAKYGGLSADHIEYADDDDARALAQAGTIAVILPGAFYTLREKQSPPIQSLRTHAVPIALATDCNPGSSPLTSVLLTMNMACTLFRMTPEESLTGITTNAARALGLSDSGKIAPGYRADLCVWDVKHPAELSYKIGYNPLKQRIFGGRT
ncbi:MAG: imidazolonepropionase [Planktomarina sp.]|nr:imidazolonepropionase [Planktomarina sp.]